MKQSFILVIVLIVLTVLAPAAWGQPAARVSTLTGRVEYRAAPGAAWQPVTAGMQLPLGATISTGFGAQATLELGAALLQVDQLTRMRIDELLEREGLTHADLFLQVGRVRAEVREVEDLQQDFRLRSPQATAAVRGTSFSFDGVNLVVFSGRVRMQNRFNQSTTLGGGEQSSIPDDGRPESGGDARESLLAVSPYAPGSEERTTGAADRAASKPTTGSLEFDYYYYGENSE